MQDFTTTTTNANALLTQNKHRQSCSVQFIHVVYCIQLFVKCFNHLLHIVVQKVSLCNFEGDNWDILLFSMSSVIENMFFTPRTQLRRNAYILVFPSPKYVFPFRIYGKMNDVVVMHDTRIFFHGNR